MGTTSSKRYIGHIREVTRLQTKWRISTLVSHKWPSVGISVKGCIVPYAHVLRVDERTKSAPLSNRTQVYPELSVQNCPAITLRAGAVLHRHYLQAVVSSMAPGEEYEDVAEEEEDDALREWM